MRVDNLLVTGVERDALELFADALDLILRSANGDLVAVAELDVNELLLANDGVQGRAALANDGAVQSGRNLNGSGRQVGELARERLQGSLDLLEGSLGGRPGVVLAGVDEKDVTPASVGRREDNVDRVFLLVLTDLGALATDEVTVDERVDLDRVKDGRRQPPNLTDDGLSRLRNTLRASSVVGSRADDLEVRIRRARDRVEARQVDLRAGREGDRAQTGADDQVASEVRSVDARVVRTAVSGKEIERLDGSSRRQVHDLR